MGLDQSVARLCNGNIESIPLGQEQEEILSAMAEDPQGNMWFGGRWGNLYRLSPGIFRIFTRREGLSESHLTGVAIDRNGHVQFLSVVTGVEGPADVEITQGLAVGQKVVIPGDNELVEGQKLRAAAR